MTLSLRQPRTAGSGLQRRNGVIELFCGAGGFSWGWERAGFKLLAAIDNDAPSLRTHELNLAAPNGLILNRDLSRFGPESLSALLGGRPHNLLAIVGGPPCQGWSKVGRGKIRSLHASASSLLRDPRNRLYKRFLNYVDHFRPPLCVMENVPGMLSIEKQNIANLIVGNFADIGYDCTYCVIDAAWFGVPQHRKRLIFIARRKGVSADLDVAGLERFAYAFRKRVLGTTNPTTVRQAIRDLPSIKNGDDEDPRPYTPSRGKPSSYVALMRTSSNGTLTDHICRAYNSQDVRAFRTMGEGMKYRELAPRFKRYRDDVFPDKYKRLYWAQPAWTVTAHLGKDCYTHIHPAQPRTISVREAARLQGFPDDYRFFGNIGDRFRQIGNAVPPLMGWGIAEFIKKRVRTGV
jgi:DNA (cytosine-5)-methyltransferase 1